MIMAASALKKELVDCVHSHNIAKRKTHRLHGIMRMLGKMCA